MKDILEEILAHKRHELERKPRSLARALTARRPAIIAEFKRRSPSRGWIHEDARVEDVAVGYARAGAAALSILTDEKYFGGHIDFIRRVRPLVDIPILRKDFIIDECQIYEARQAGADAVLLIAAALPLDRCAALIDCAHSLGLEVLLELHDAHELPYAALPADVIGVNNRCLGTFHTDIQASLSLAPQLPASRPLVSESGIHGPETIRTLQAAGYQGFLMGEYFMREADPAKTLATLLKNLQATV